MPEETRPPEHRGVRYEKTDVSLRAILVTLAIAVGVGMLIFLMVWFYLGYERDRLADERKSGYPLAAHPPTELPLEPRLEQIDRLSKEAAEPGRLRIARQHRELSRYGTATEKGYVRIPIQRAMDLLADRLPVRENVPETGDRDHGLVDAGAPNSGRMFRKEAPWAAR